MTDYKFTVNGADFSDLVHKNGIRTYLEPVHSGETVNLDKVRRRVIKRYRNILHVTINDAERSRVQELCAALLAQPLNIGYYHWQRGRRVTDVMALDPYAMQRLLEDGGEDWMAGVTLKFEQE